MHDLALLLHNDSIVLAILERKFLLLGSYGNLLSMYLFEPLPCNSSITISLLLKIVTKIYNFQFILIGVHNREANQRTQMLK